MIPMSIRASDADRDRVAELLREHTAQGRLSLEEFTQRVGVAYTATTRGELERLVADLPGGLPSAHDAGNDPAPGGAAPRGLASVLAACCGGIPLACLVLLLTRTA